jgi:hypothetical protein
MQLPRWRLVAELLLLPQITNTVFISLTYLLISAIVVDYVWPDIIPRLRSITPLLSFALLSASVLTLSLGISRSWYANRGELYQSEHYLVLVALAVLASMTLGLLNYLTYRVDSGAFLVEQRLHDKLVAGVIRGAHERLTRSELVLRACNDLRVALISSRQEHLPVVKDFMNAKVLIPQSHVDLYIQRERSRVIGLTAIAFVAIVQGRKAQLMPPELGWRLFIEQNFVHWSWVKKEELLNALDRRANREHVDEVASAERAITDAETLAIPPSLFLYQGAMDTFGSGPGYFTPVGFLPRTVALVYAGVKYVFFGLFVALLSGRAASKQSGDCKGL